MDYLDPTGRSRLGSEASHFVLDSSVSTKTDALDREVGRGGGVGGGIKIHATEKMYCKWVALRPIFHVESRSSVWCWSFERCAPFRYVLFL